jgi:hypothetical protein
LEPAYEVDVFVRMAKDASEKPKREAMMRKKLRKMIDSKTGQPLFTPQLIRNDDVEEVL